MPNGSVDELENRAARERERVNRDVAQLRQGVRRELDIRGRIEDRIQERPAAAYGAAAGAALLAGYAIARMIKQVA
jgi:hypothetical protein